MESQKDMPIQVISGEFSAEIEVKHSRFIATVKGELNEEQAIEFVSHVRKKYYDATHNCYAFIGDEAGQVARFSDDGEPGGTAGMPMLQVLKRKDLKKTAVVVTRYFGGILLGAGGLVSAYTKAVTTVLDIAKIVIKKRVEIITLECSFSDFSRLNSLLNSPYIKVLNTDYAATVTLTVAVITPQVPQFLTTLTSITKAAPQIKATYSSTQDMCK